MQGQNRTEINIDSILCSCGNHRENSHPNSVYKQSVGEGQGEREGGSFGEQISFHP